MLSFVALDTHVKLGGAALGHRQQQVDVLVAAGVRARVGDVLAIQLRFGFFVFSYRIVACE